jgi:hypothetical protein
VSRLQAQVTVCYKERKWLVPAPYSASNSLLLALLLAFCVVVVAGCGSPQPPARFEPTLLRAGDLPGWQALQVAPGIGELAPDLSGLAVRGRVDASALVRAGNAARASALLFATPAAAARAFARALEPRYAAFLERALGGAVVGRGPGVGYRLRVTRGSESGSDTAEVYVVRRGRVLALVELVSGTGFPRAARDRLLDLVRQRLALSR